MLIILTAFFGSPATLPFFFNNKNISKINEKLEWFTPRFHAT
jgi:hypothetical protein